VIVLDELWLLGEEEEVQVPEDTPQIVADLVVVVDITLLQSAELELQAKVMLVQPGQMVVLAVLQVVVVVLAHQGFKLLTTAMVVTVGLESLVILLGQELLMLVVGEARGSLDILPALAEQVVAAMG
jgi:hypothetical protein